MLQYFIIKLSHTTSHKCTGIVHTILLTNYSETNGLTPKEVVLIHFKSNTVKSTYSFVTDFIATGNSPATARTHEEYETKDNIKRTTSQKREFNYQKSLVNKYIPDIFL